MEAAMVKNYSRVVGEQKIKLPPGYRFHPTDEELITYYLSKKVLDSNFCAIAIAEADLNKCEPWDLPFMAKMGESEWYFFCMRDRKYPTGLRTNRATNAGYWKATGKDKEIFRGLTLIGMKKTLVFYKGRAPRGEKSNWVMHEFRLEEDKHSVQNLPNPAAMKDWAICRVFEKGANGKKMHVPLSPFAKEVLLPPLMDSSPYNSETTKNAIGESSHHSQVTSFSGPNQTDEQRTTKDDIVDSFETPVITSSYSSNPSDISPAPWTFTNVAPTVPHQSTQITQVGGTPQGSDYLMVQEQSMLRMLIENHGSSTETKYQNAQERDFDADNSSVMYNNPMFPMNQEYSSASVGQHVDTGFLWNF